MEVVMPYSNHDGFVKRAWTFLKFAWRCSKIALREPCDLVFATSTPLTIAIPGLVAKLLRGKPFVFEVRDLWPELPKAMGVIRNPFVLLAMDWLEWCAYHAADRVIGLAPGMLEGISRRGIDRSRISIVPNGSDLDLFRPGQPAQRLPGVSDEHFLAVFAGAHGIANGVDIVLDAASILMSRKNSSIRIAMVGDGKCKPALVERARREGLSNVLFFDPLPKREIARVLASADAGLMTLQNIPAFYYGTSPNKFFDYIASGVAVVNNYPGWLADMILESRCGIVCPPADAVSFADALERLAAEPEACAEMGRRARLLAERRFGRDQLGSDFVGAVESAVPPRAPSRGLEQDRQA
jgi:glycosyltransferase involved in cell wall biosynthesis